MTGRVCPQRLVLQNMETRKEFKLTLQSFGSWIHLNFKEEDSQNK